MEYNMKFALRPYIMHTQEAEEFDKGLFWNNGAATEFVDFCLYKVGWNVYY